MNWVNLDNLKKFYTKLKEKIYLKTEVDTKVDTKANKSDVLTLEEIQASPDLTGKIASASALSKTLPISGFHHDGVSLQVSIIKPCVIILKGNGDSTHIIGFIPQLSESSISVVISNGTYDTSISYNSSTNMLTLPTSGEYTYIIL